MKRLIIAGALTALLSGCVAPASVNLHNQGVKIPDSTSVFKDGDEGSYVCGDDITFHVHHFPKLFMLIPYGMGLDVWGYEGAEGGIERDGHHIEIQQALSGERLFIYKTDKVYAAHNESGDIPTKDKFSECKKVA